MFLATRDKIIGPREQQAGLLLTWGALVAVAVCMYFMFTPAPVFFGIRKVSTNIALAPAVAVLVYCAARYKSSIAAFLSRPLLVRLGDASYSIYLVHILIFYWVERSLPNPYLPDTAAGIFLGALRMLFVLVVLAAVSIGLYRVVEMPARRWLRSMWTEGTAVRRQVLGILMLPACVACALLIVVQVWGLGDESVTASSDRTAMIINEATYGGNCASFKVPVPQVNLVQPGNATAAVRLACSGKRDCIFHIDVVKLGDPANSCVKDFVAKYWCAGEREMRTATVAGEANGKDALLFCERK